MESPVVEDRLSPEALRLARTIAAATGERVEQVILRLLEESVAKIRPLPPRLDRAEREARLWEIAKRASAELGKTPIDHGELLYDEHGLPK